MVTTCQASVIVSLLALSSIGRDVTALQAYSVGPVNERAVECPDDPGQIGYKHVIDINVDQRTELDNIARGAAPRKPYVFPFCSRFKFNMNEEVLQVLLDEMTFACGYNGENSELCILEGGPEQVNVPEGQTTNVEFVGMTFANFTDISTKAHGAGKITFTDAHWWNFRGAQKAVHQMNPSGGAAMEVVVNKALIDNGDARHFLDNVGGTLTVTDLTVKDNVNVYALMATSNGGTASLTMADVSLSHVVRVTSTSSGSSTTVRDVTIHDMYGLGTNFYVANPGSTLDVETITVTNNYIDQAFRAGWSRNFKVIGAEDGATANSRTITFVDNNGVDRVFSASSGSQVSGTDATITNAVGTTPPDLLSGLAAAEDGSVVNLLRLTIDNVDAFSAGFLAICASKVQVRQSCINSGTLQSPVFISADSELVSSYNYISDSVISTECLLPGASKVFKETAGVGSLCLLATGKDACQGGCVEGFNDQAVCQSSRLDLAQALSQEPTPAMSVVSTCPAAPPTPEPTPPPTQAPIEGGTTPPPQFGVPPGGWGVPPGEENGGGSGGGSGGNGGSGGGSGGSGGGSGGGGGSGAHSVGRPVMNACAGILAGALYNAVLL